jgi:hypothetical protein
MRNIKPIDEMNTRIAKNRALPDRVSANFRLKKDTVLKLRALSTIMQTSNTKVLESMIDAVHLMNPETVNRLPMETELVERLEGAQSLWEKLS